MSRLRLQKITAFFTSSLRSRRRNASRLPFVSVQVEMLRHCIGCLAGGSNLDYLWVADKFFTYPVNVLGQGGRKTGVWIEE